MKRILCFALSFLLILPITFKFSANAEIATEYYSEDLTADTDGTVYASTEPEISGLNTVLMEKNTKTVLSENNSHEKAAPASITKIMSLILIMEAIDSGKLKLDTRITASEHACSMGGSQIWLEPGEEMTVDELLKAVVVASANDATVALAEAIAGSEEAFVDAMNKKAATLKMEDTHFENCSGLDADGHLSSAYDIAVMSCELLKHDLIKNYTTIWMDSLRGGTSELVNTNKLVRFYSGATGLKTGTTSKAGFCVSATAEKNGMELCAVVLGAKNNDERFGTAKKLLNFGFANYKTKTVSEKDINSVTLKVEGGTENSVVAVPSGSINCLISSNEDGDLTLDTACDGKVTAPIAKGQKLGSVTVKLKNKEIGQVDLVAETTVERLTFKKVLIFIIKSLFKL